MRYVLYTLILLVAIAIVYATRHILLAAFLGFVLANFFVKLSAWSVGEGRVLRPLVAMGYLLLGGMLVAGILWIGSPSLSEQADELQKTSAKMIDQTRDWLERRDWGNSLLRLENESSTARTVLSNLAHLAGGLFDSLGAIAVLAAVMVFGLVDPTPYHAGILWLVPERHQGRTRTELSRISRVLTWWLLGRLASMMVVGMLTWLGLWLLGIPAPLALGFLAGILGFVPNLGPILALIPAVVVALTVGPWSVLWVTLLYVGVQAVETNIITPLIQQEAVRIPPALLVAFQLMMGIFAGIWGMVVATPLLVVAMLLVQTLYIRDGLNKDIKLVSESHGHD